MELRNCPECDKLFTFITINLCPTCQKKDEEDFQKARKYLRDNPDKNIAELARETEVEERKIVRWVREGKFQSKFFSKLTLPCENCGTPISSGRYCQSCSKNLADGFKKAFDTSSKEKEHIGEKSAYHTRRI